MATKKSLQIKHRKGKNRKNPNDKEILKFADYREGEIPKAKKPTKKIIQLDDDEEEDENIMEYDSRDSKPYYGADELSAQHEDDDLFPEE